MEEILGKNNKNKENDKLLEDKRKVLDGTSKVRIYVSLQSLEVDLTLALRLTKFAQLCQIQLLIWLVQICKKSITCIV